jgi:endonuclease YncB( thermonuclease family)
MNLRSRFTRFVVAFATALSLIAGVVAVPASAASVGSASVGVSSGVSAAAGIGAKKKVLTTEQKKAKSALDKAVKDLKSKEKNLKAAIKAQAKTAKAHAKAAKAAQTAQIRNVKGASKKVKARARAAAKKLATAKAQDDRAIALVARRTVMRDTAQAKVIRLDAKYAWLINDISTLQCGVGTTVTTASGAVETVRECGIVYMHEDGDTTHVKTTTNKLMEIRNIGLQTPERAKRNTITGAVSPAQCGAEEAYQHFKALMPEEITIVQMRSLSDSTNGWGGNARPTRSVYKLNNATGQFDIDVQAEQIKAGWSLWWPLAAEWANNKTYLDLMLDARARGVGLWNPNLCGASPGGVPSMWFNQNAPAIDGNSEPAFGEYVILKNETSAAMDLTNWSLRNNSLNFFWSSSRSWMQGQNKFGSMILQPGEHRIVYLDNPDNYELSSSEYRYFNWGHSPGAQITNGSVSASFSPNYAHGEGIYLQDPRGNIRNSMINPCSSSAMCDTPAWAAEIISSTRAGQIIPIPVALNKVANDTRDRYNPVVSIASGALATATKTALATAGFTAADGAVTIDSALPIGQTLAITRSATYNASENINGVRIPIADVTGTARTTLYVHAASGSNAFPTTLVGMTTQQATDTLAAAGFRSVTTAVGPSASGVAGTVASLTVGGSAPGARHLLTSAIVLTIHP